MFKWQRMKKKSPVESHIQHFTEGTTIPPDNRTILLYMSYATPLNTRNAREIAGCNVYSHNHFIITTHRAEAPDCVY